MKQISVEDCRKMRKRERIRKEASDRSLLQRSGRGNDDEVLQDLSRQDSTLSSDTETGKSLPEVDPVTDITYVLSFIFAVSWMMDLPSACVTTLLAMLVVLVCGRLAFENGMFATTERQSAVPPHAN